MKTLTLILSLLYSAAVYADGCYTYTIMIDGRMYTCTKCCYYGQCNTTCI